MDDTQRLQWDDEEQDVSFDRDKPVGNLHMFNGIHGPAQDFPIYPGTNIIGRHTNCDVTLPAQSVSKKHAIIEVEADCHTLCDQGSLNKTRRGKAAIAPHVRYALSDGDLLLFADVACRYSFTKKLEEEEAENEESEDDILVPGTQATLSIEKTPGVAIRRMGRGAVLAMDSGDEEEEELKGKDLNYEAKGLKTSGEECKSPASASFSHNMDTIVPESDEENDTSVSEPRFPSLNLRCDSDTDTHDTPMKAGTSYTPSQDCVLSPSFKEQVVGDHSEITKSTLISNQEMFADEQVNTESKVSKCSPDTADKNDRETKEENNTPIVNTNIAEEGGTGVTDDPLIDGLKVENQKKENDCYETLQVDIKQQESVKIILDSNQEENRTLKVKLVNTGSADIILDKNIDGEEGCVNTKEIDNQIREGAFHLDSDTDVEESDTSIPGINVPRVENSGNNTDSDTDTEEDKPKILQPAIQQNVEEGFNLDSDTDVEGNDSNSVNKRLKNTEKAKMIQDSDTDADDSIMSKVEERRNPAGTKKDYSSTSLNTEGKRQENYLSTLDSDTDVEDIADGSSPSVVKKQDKAEAAHTNVTDTTAGEETCTDAGIEKIVVSADRNECHTGGVTQEQEATSEFHLDSDTDIEEDDNLLDMSSASTRVKVTEVHSVILEKLRTSPGERKEKRAIEIDLDSNTDVDEADETEVDRKETFHMDSDTDLEENDSGPPVVGGIEKKFTAIAHSDCTSDTGSNVKNVTSSITENTEKGETDGIDCEDAEYQMMATQCYLEPQEKETDIQDEDDCAEEATQAFIFSSTWAEPEPFKRPADPIGVLQISAVTVSSSEEEPDENAIAETQPFCCEIKQPEEHSDQEPAKKSSIAEEKNNVACSLPQEEISQDDTQPVSQYLNKTASSNLVAPNLTCTTNFQQEKYLDGINEEKVKQANESVPNREEQLDEGVQDIEEDATQPYVLSLPTVGDMATQPCSMSESVSGDGASQYLNTVVPAVASVASLPCNPSMQLSDGEPMQPSSLNEADATQCHGFSMPLKEGDTVSISEEKVSVKQGPCRGESSMISEQLDPSNNVMSKHPGEVLVHSVPPLEKATEQVAEQPQAATRMTEEDREENKGKRRSTEGEDSKDSAEVTTSVTRGKKRTWKKTASPASEETKGKKTAKMQVMEKALPEAKMEEECKEEQNNKPNTSSILARLKTGRKGKQDIEEPLDYNVEGYNVSVQQVEEDMKRFTSRRSVRKPKDGNDQETGSRNLPEITRHSSLDLSESVVEKKVDMSSDEHMKYQKDDEFLTANGTTINVKRKGAKRNVKEEENKFVVDNIPGKRPTRNNRPNVTEKNNEEADDKQRITRRNSRQLEIVEIKPDNTEILDSKRQNQSRKSPNIKKNLKVDESKETEKCEGKTRENTPKRTSRRTKKKCTEELNMEEWEKSKEEADSKQRVTRRNSRLSESVESIPEDTDIVDSEQQDQSRKSRNIKKNLKRGEEEKLEGTNRDNTEKWTSRRTRKECKEKLNMEDHEKSKVEPSIEQSEQEHTEAEGQDQSRKSRKTKKDLPQPVINEEETLVETIRKDSVGRTSRRRKKSCIEEDLMDSEVLVISKPEQEDPPTKNVPRSKRKNLKDEPKEGDTEHNVFVSKNENLDEMQTTQRKSNSKDGDVQNDNKTLCEVDSKSGNSDIRTRKKKKVVTGTQKTTEVEGEMLDGSMTIDSHEDVSPTGMRKSRRTTTKEELLKSTTLAPVRKRGQQPKTGGDEVKRKKVNEEFEQEKTVGRRGQARQPKLEDENTDGNSFGKDSAVPFPSPSGNSRLRPSTSFESPTEGRTPRRAARSLTTSPYMSQRSIAAKVLFTGVVDPAGEETIRNLGGEVAESIFDCTHLVTDRIRRTVKFLCALAKGIPIVTLDWLDKCKKSRCFLSPAQFLVNDKEQEKSFNFDLSESLQKAKKKLLFEGYEIHVTPNVKPEPEHMKDIIQCSGATFLPKMPKVYKDKCIIVSCKEDATRCKSAPSTIPVTSAEFILTGILRQEINPHAYLLSTGPEEALPTPAKRRR
ncbi:mediator of DNA damage checkpoint protein 1 isoform X2 [Xenopus tropicalis]|uniref:Mediator of DNA damage checkpoint protein 1 n=1 Tax=Xenopus tropicalis TaxID=8364 RepID=A0A8J0QR36_XENTR|nr:mediator of DNA damage checkpoint protein 1 isoform X2 [Xenopus tropicalis]